MVRFGGSVFLALVLSVTRDSKTLFLPDGLLPLEVFGDLVNALEWLVEDGRGGMP